VPGYAAWSDRRRRWFSSPIAVLLVVVVRHVVVGRSVAVVGLAAVLPALLGRLGAHPPLLATRLGVA
jgi:hypothetical protein